MSMEQAFQLAIVIIGALASMLAGLILRQLQRIQDKVGSIETILAKHIGEDEEARKQLDRVDDRVTRLEDRRQR